MQIQSEEPWSAGQATGGATSMSCKENLEAFLREHAVPFEAHHHPRVYTAQRVAEAEHVSGRIVMKVVMAFGDGKMVMLAVPAHRNVNLVKAAGAVGAKAMRLAHEDEFAAAFPDCEVGAMPPFGNLYGIKTCVDTELAKDDTVVFNAGTHEDTIHMKFADFQQLVEPIVADLSGG
jgi:Ala-tRNA(Pro) deacylase